MQTNTFRRPAAGLMTRPVDARGARGVQAGEHGTQINFCVSEVAEVAWPVRVGVVPALADCYRDRPRESAELVASTAATACCPASAAWASPSWRPRTPGGWTERDLASW